MKTRIVTLMCALMVAVFAFAGESVTAVFNLTPALACQNCEKKVKENIRFVKGVKSIETSVKDNTVTITFDPANLKCDALKEAFKKIGYDIAPANANACAKTATCDKTKACKKAEPCKNDGKCKKDEPCKEPCHK